MSAGIAAIEAWQARDANLEAQFDQASSMQFRYMMGRLLRKIKQPDLNHYRDHLLAGRAIGAIPSDGIIAEHFPLDKLAVEDYETLVRTDGALRMQTEFSRRGIIKIWMDLVSGKSCLTTEEELEPEAAV